ncbi:MAG: PqqD family protein [Candidatus Dechloromonas phosphoritropha]|jgi:hypothetical protein
MNLSDSLSIPSQVMARTVGDETVILDLASGTYFGLDPIGARIWELMGEGKTLAEISATMLEEYEVTAEQLQGDVIKLAGELAERGLVLKA